MQRVGKTFWRGMSLTALLLAGVALGGCQAEPSKPQPGAERIKSDPKERFTEGEYGVKASPRVTDLKKVRKGGGREQVGRPYKVRGKWYYPKEQAGYTKVGKASWYGSSFHGRLTANGEIYDMFGLSGAHPTFPLPSYAKVTNLETGANVVVRVNDRGPYVADRVMDLSSEAADMLGYKGQGVGTVKVEYVGKAPLEGDDTPTLMASFHPGKTLPSVNDGLATGVMLAMNEPSPRYGFTKSKGVSTLPGVKVEQMGKGDGVSASTSIDAIINAAEATPNKRTLPIPMPRSRNGSADVVVASFAPVERRATNAAADAIAAMSRQAVHHERIEIGSVTDPNVLNAIREIASRYGRLVAEPDHDATAYALEVDENRDADAVLEALWRSGAADAFAIRD